MLGLSSVFWPLHYGGLSFSTYFITMADCVILMWTNQNAAKMCVLIRKYLTRPLQKALGNYSFLPFVGFLTTFWLFTYFKVPETKNRTIEEITAQFRRDDDGRSSVQYQSLEPESDEAINSDQWSVCNFKAKVTLCTDVLNSAIHILLIDFQLGRTSTLFR